MIQIPRKFTQIHNQPLIRQGFFHSLSSTSEAALAADAGFTVKSAEFPQFIILQLPLLLNGLQRLFLDFQGQTKYLLLDVLKRSAASARLGR